MSDWAKQPYRGGKMIDLPGFPRPIYPPDAEAQGQKPSRPGPDVIGYKRVVARLGRWKWDPDGWDQSFSNEFAHGKAGGDVGVSGMAGVQRQANVDPATGWVGERTFNLLRSVKIPEGLPHAGEYAMDGIAQDLFVSAWEKFKGSPAAPSTGSVREAALAEARKWIGTKESPPNSNRVKFSDWYGMVGPWCAMFETYCYEVAAEGVGKACATFARSQRYAYVPYILNDAKNGRNGLSVTPSPRPGDIVVYDWNLDHNPDHTGIFEKWVSSTQFTAIEGNTSIDNDSNGGEVMRRTRTKGAGVVFVQVHEP
jgi:CHAP domain